MTLFAAAVLTLSMGAIETSRADTPLDAFRTLARGLELPAATTERLDAHVFRELPSPRDGITYEARRLDGSEDPDRFALELRALRGEDVIGHRVYVFPIPRFERVVVPSRAIRAGETIAFADLVEVERDVSGQRDPQARRVGDLVGAVAVRGLAPDRPIALRHVKAPAAIERGESVVVRVLTGGLTVSMKGKAIESAALGESVRVTNPESGRVLDARVVERGVAEVSKP